MTLAAAHFSSQLCFATSARCPHSWSFAAHRDEHSAAGTGEPPLLLEPELELDEPEPELDEPEPELELDEPEPELDDDVLFGSSEDEPHPATTRATSRGEARR